jgi:undecaprenyl-diphosphatase
MSWLESLLLGIVQGLTEFLPISSDGHLTLFQVLFARRGGRDVSGAENLFFDVMLHLGTMVAIVAYYRGVVAEGARGLLGATDVKPWFRREVVVRAGLLVFVATLPLIPDALFLKDWFDRASGSLTAAGVGFLITAAVLAITMRLSGGDKRPAETTWRDALLVGIAQMFAPLPGVSRSGLTIATALALGFSRAWAVGFSLMMAVPAILGAAVFELRKARPAHLAADRIAQTATAAIVAGLIGYAAIAWLVRVVRSGKLWYFSVYLVVLGGAILVGEAARGGRTDGRQSPALDRPVRGGPGRPGDRLGPGRGGGPVGRRLGDGAPARLLEAGSPPRRRVPAEGLDLA